MVLNLMAKVVNITNPTKKQQIHRICQTTMNVPGVPPGGLNSSIPPRSFIIHLLNNLSSGVGFTYCQSKIVKNKYVHIIFEWKLSIHRYKYINTHIHFNIYIYINISLHLRKYKYTYSIHFSPQKNTKKPLASLGPFFPFQTPQCWKWRPTWHLFLFLQGTNSQLWPIMKPRLRFFVCPKP